MKKTLLAAAVAGAFGAPAFAQTASPGTVTLYGRLNLGIDDTSSLNSHTNTATVNRDYKSRVRIFDSSSRIGVRGTEDLGGGLRAIFQIESGVNANNGQQTAEGGQLNTSAGTLGSRPSWVGLEGGWGRLTFGRQDVFWANGTIHQTGANYVNTDIPWLTGNVGRISAGISRQSDVMQYTSPTVAGANMTLSYSPDTGVAGYEQTVFNNAQAAGQGKNTNARLFGVTLRWSGGPFQAQYDWAYKQSSSDYVNVGPSYNPGCSTPGAPVVAGCGIQTAGYAPAYYNLQPKAIDQKIGLAWAYLPGGQISIIGTHVRNVGVVGPDVFGWQNLAQNTLGLNWEHLLAGNILLMAQYSHMFRVTGCNDSGVSPFNPIPGQNNQSSVCDHSDANGYMVGVRYNLSKRTGVYATFNMVKNGQNQYADYWGGAMAAGTTGSQVYAPGGNTQGTIGNVGSPGIPGSSKGSAPTIIGLGIQHNF